MDYKLAKELKDAGFPQSSSPDADVVYDIICAGTPDIDYVDPCFAPTLSELMGAFQGRYKYIGALINDAQILLRKSISASGIIYIASLDGAWESPEIEQEWRFVCSTPEEAVARLWLALNKK